MCRNVFACMSPCVPAALGDQKNEPGTRVIDSMRHVSVLGPKLGPLQEQPVLLTVALSLQPFC